VVDEFGAEVLEFFASEQPLIPVVSVFGFLFLLILLQHFSFLQEILSLFLECVLIE
jgi:hypothetical protein